MCLIVCAALTLTLAVVLQKRDDEKKAAAQEVTSGTSEDANQNLVRRERIIVASDNDTKHGTMAELAASGST